MTARFVDRLLMPLRRLAQRATSHAQLGVSGQLTVGFGLLLLLVLLTGAIGWFAIGELALHNQKLVDVDFERVNQVARMEKSVADMALAAATIASTDDPNDIAYESERLRVVRTEYVAAAESLTASFAGDLRAEPIVLQLQAVDELRLAASTVMEQIAVQATAGASREALADFAATQIRGPQSAWIGELLKLREQVQAESRQGVSESRDRTHIVKMALVVTVIFALMAGMTAARLISGSVLRPIRQAASLATSVADGDLTTKAASDRQDEIGVLLKALTDMQGKLHGIVGNIATAAEAVRRTSHDSGVSSTELALRTTRTADTLQRATSSMRALQASVQTCEEAALSAGKVADRAEQAARLGSQLMQEVVDNMASISLSSRRITDITSVIDGLAFQTNLLALNAAVEAGRAGEHGRGFAVVATEVRSLAKRSAEASQEIASLIAASTFAVQSGTRLVEGAGDTMGKIRGAADEVTRVVSSIQTAAHRQSVQLKELSGEINEVDGMTEKNSVLVEQSAHAAQTLSDQAGRLNALISTFRLEG